MSTSRPAPAFTRSTFLPWASLGLALAASGLAQAQEVGLVLSSTPITQRVGTPRQVCTQEQVAVQPANSGAGAVLGAVTGGALGSASGGRGPERAAAAAVGAVAGAILGDKLEGRPEPQLRTVQHCSTQMSYENRVVAYNVVYQYAGKQYSVQMPQDPGPTIAVQVAPVASAPLPAAPVADDTVIIDNAPPATIVLQTAPVYLPRPYYGPRIVYDYGPWRRHHH